MDRRSTLIAQIMALEPVERRAVVEEIYLRVFDTSVSESLRVSGERISSVERGISRMLPFDEAMRVFET
ncbi:hypothetical protein [Luteolibacter luteus]|uniref:Uncharacterized protein n=1 Tax=Luteolibacter luteus TaxID=2728835 RepID=A0A858RQC8_9BACT|nr:hypothetical protein [Luteolibacter luteus]QJE98330.1 hypothetical protein HHL09_21945 [Luteolibacter luteus]